MNPQVIVSDRAKSRLKGKHPWIFSNEIKNRPDLPPGEIVEILDRQGNRIGTGYYNHRTLIAVRMLSFRGDFDFENRLATAVDYRNKRFSDRMHRLVYSESDGLPGLIVDRYGQTLVVQVLTAGMERLREKIISSLVTSISPARILFKNDSPYRELEGLPQSIEWVYGDAADSEVVECDGLKFLIGFRGQKTGFFLDQRENRNRLKQYARGDSMLDVFSYTGSWSLYSAQAGLKDITAVDSSSDALEILKKNASLNSYDVEIIERDAIQFLRDASGHEKRYDLIVLDPPAFAKSKKHLNSAIRAYRELNLRGMKLLKPGGVLFTCSCSQALPTEAFETVLRQAASASGRSFRILEMRSQSTDHPVLLNFPESHYLKCAILELL